ncbi:hypothetical protein ACGC1H_002032 [Rhizoctonia solani]
MCKVCFLARILDTMDLCAPVFRRACPESGTTFVNLSMVSTSFNVNVELYVTRDVLLGAITYRSVNFRYDLEFSSLMVEEFLHADDGPGSVAYWCSRPVGSYARKNEHLFGGTWKSVESTGSKRWNTKPWLARPLFLPVRELIPP